MRVRRLPRHVRSRALTSLAIAACSSGTTHRRAARRRRAAAPDRDRSGYRRASRERLPTPPFLFAAIAAPRRRIAAAAATVAPAVAAALSATDVGVTKDAILIGGTDPLSGPAAAYGTIAKASDAYFHYVNDNGGVNGRQITYKYLDDAYNPAQTVPLTKQLVEQDQVFLMFAGLGTQAQTSVRDYLNGKKVPQVFVATGATTFSAEFEKYPYTFGWQPVYQGESLIYAQYILKNTPNAKIGVIYQNDDYGQDYLDGLTKGLGSKAAEMIVDKESNDVGAPDLNSQILKLKNSGADTFFVFETPSPAIKALVATFQAGWHPTIYLNSVAAPVPYVQAAQKAAGRRRRGQRHRDGGLPQGSGRPGPGQRRRDPDVQADHDQVLRGRQARGRLQHLRHGHRLEPGGRAQESRAEPDPPGGHRPAQHAERDRKSVHVSRASRSKTPAPITTRSPRSTSPSTTPRPTYYKPISQPIDVRGQIKFP